MKKIIIVFDANPLVGKKSGVGYLTQSLIVALANKYPNEIELVGHYFNFLNKKDDSSLPSASNIRYKKTTLVPTKLINILRKIKIELPIELFCFEKPDYYFYTNFVSLPSIRKTRQIVVVHDLSFVDVPEYVSTANASFLKKFVPRSIKRASLVVTISEFSKQRIIEAYSPSAPVVVIPVPPEIKLSNDNSVLKKYKIPKQYLLFVGTIEPRKNLKTLLDAYENIYKKTGVSLVLVGGKGWKDDALLNQIKSLQDKNFPVISTGYVSDEDKFALFKNATIYIQPSHYEGFGMPILEAMALGTPVVCSDIPVFHETAENSAVYFDQTSSSELASKVTELLNNPGKLENLKKMAIQRSSKYPTWNEVAAQIRKLVS